MSPPIIPLVDLHAQYASLKPAIDAAIQRVLASGQFVLGPEGEALEGELAAFCGTAEAVAVASGTDALELSLRACGIGPGDEVITSAFSFFATAEAVVAVGATPVFVDIDLSSFTIDPAAMAAAISPRTKAILPVHLYGHPCDLDAILAVAEANRLPVIEDCAQAIGARDRQRPVGSRGAAGCFSFYPSKNLGAYGDGGMVVTQDRALAQRLRLLRNHGSRDRYVHETMGRNSRLDELQAAIVRAKLPYVEAWNQARRTHAQTYRSLIEREGLTAVVLPQERAGCDHVYHVFAVRVPNRDVVCERLKAQGIGVQVHYGMTLPQQPALRSVGGRQGRSPEAERAASEVLSLPLYPELTNDQIHAVVRALRNAL